MSKQLKIDFASEDKVREQQELENLYKDSPDDYEFSWQYQANK